ncbi:hypothetical protein [Nostoc spongiaeforme]|uniref:hypothetical protein n=1 Tax=Nostoc spongiaeforme TaxID=502487 RepID=UPI001F54D54F|nr:hypothetical protein [Nostoc spongiaeforme]
MVKIPIALRRLVIQRAADRCEYCCLSQAGQAVTFCQQLLTYQKFRIKNNQRTFSTYNDKLR